MTRLLHLVNAARFRCSAVQSFLEGRLEDLQVLVVLAGKQLVPVQGPHAVQLVEHRVVRGIDLIPPIDLAADQEIVQATADQVVLVGSRVSTQQVVPVDVVAVAAGPTRMIRCNEQIVEVLLGRDHRTETVVDAEGGIASIRAVRRVEEVDDALPKDGQWVVAQELKGSGFRKKEGGFGFFLRGDFFPETTESSVSRSCSHRR